MADVLYYAALDKYLYADTQLAAAQDQKTRADTRLSTAKTTYTNCQTCLTNEIAAKEARQAAAGTIYCLNAALCQDPTNITNWASIPKKFTSQDCTSYDGFFCVGDASANAEDPLDQAGLNSCCCTCGYQSGLYRCGGCYQWTVPAGVCCVEMEVWGSGGWTTGGCCCGGSPFGASGAFGFINMTVCPGETYQLCAGCAACCTCACSGGASIMDNSGSTVCGPGISMCAQGANTWYKNQTTNNYPGGIRCCSRVAAPNCIQASRGGCWCNSGQNWCFGNSCSSCGVIPMGPAMSYFGGCVTPTRPGTTYTVGIRGMHGCFCYDTDNYGYYKSPPIPMFDQVSQCRLTHTSNSCHGCTCCAGTGFNAYPGQGGTRTHAMGGSTNCKGDNGRTGWIRVRYCCI